MPLCRRELFGFEQSDVWCSAFTNIRKLFQKYDQNRSGTLIHEELSGMFSDAGLPCSAQEINEAMIRFKTFSFHSGDRSAGSAEATLVTLLTMKELMKTMKKKKYLKPNGTSSIPVTMLEFYNLWRFSREDSFTDVTRVTNRLCDLRIQLGGSVPCGKAHWCLVKLWSKGAVVWFVIVLLLCCLGVVNSLFKLLHSCSICAGEKYSIFFGFNYDDWQSANHLVRTNVVNWSTRDVAKWFSFENDLAPIRKYITRDDLNEMDGETLLEVDRYVLCCMFSIVVFNK